MRDRILVFLFGDIGDTLLTVPALRALRRRYPSSHIAVLAKQLPLAIVSELGLVDETILVDKHIFDRPVALLRPRALAGLVRLTVRLRAGRFDTVVLFHHLVTKWGALKFALLSLVTGAPERAGIDNGRGWFLTRRVKDRGFGYRHEAEYYLEVSALLDAPGSVDLEMPITETDRVTASRLLETGSYRALPILAIHPGTGWYGPGRRWTAEGFAAAASIIVARQNMRCVVVGTAEETGEANAVSGLLGDRALNLVGKTSLGELAAVLERSALLLANDGGVAHVAAAVDTPVVAVFGPSNDKAWRPLTGYVVAVDLPCRPCFYRDYERGLPAGCATRECLDMVSPESVARAALRILREQKLAV